jgi:hypothetical protein
MATQDELDAAADAKIAAAIQILKEDNAMRTTGSIAKDVARIKAHLNIPDEETENDPDKPPAPPKKDKPEDDPPKDDPTDPPSNKTRHWLYGEIES